jgi:predicted  nucleic acid-binding Zn-ribbon protein
MNKHYPKIAFLRKIRDEHELYRDEIEHKRTELAELHLQLRRNKIGTIQISRGEIMAMKERERKLENDLQLLEVRVNELNQNEGTLSQIKNKLRTLEPNIY